MVQTFPSSYYVFINKEMNQINFRQFSSTTYNPDASLRKVWQENIVDEAYQNAFLAYLDSLGDAERKRQILREYQRMLDKSSFYFKIKQLNQDRIEILQQIHQYGHSEQQMNFLCMKVDELRKTNLYLAEQVINEANYLHKINLIEPRYSQLLKKMNEDNKNIKHTILGEYIIFSSGFDLFFLHHYQLIRNSTTSLKESTAVKNLFNMNISSVFRLIKAKKQILHYLTQRDQTEEQSMSEVKLHKSSLINEKEKKKFDRKNTSKFSSSENSKITEKINKSYQKEEIIKKLKEKEEIELQQFRQKMLRKKKHSNYSEIQEFFKQRNFKERQQSQNLRSKNLHPQMTPFAPSQKNKSTKQFSKSKKSRYLFPASKKHPETQPPSRTKILIPVQRQKGKRNQNIIYKDIQDGTKYRVHNSLHKKEKKRIITQHQTEYQDEGYKASKNSKKSKSINKNLPQINSRYEVDSNHRPNQKQENKSLKIIPGNLSIQELFPYIRKIKIQPKYRQLFEKGSWTEKFIHNQSYLTQFYLGNQMGAFCLTLPTPAGNYRIGYWAPLQGCPEKINIFFFKKYLQHLEKKTNLRFLYLSSLIFDGIEEFGFEKHQNFYKRKRFNLNNLEQQEFKFFASFEFVNICFKQNSEEILFSSEECQNFDEECEASSTALALEQPEFSNEYAHYHKIQSLKKANSLISQYSMEKFVPISLKQKIQNIRLFCINWFSSLKRYFLHQKGYLISDAYITHQEQQQLICELKLEKNDFRIFFGKGFRNVNNFLQKISLFTTAQTSKIGVKCFFKQILGRIQCERKGLGCYGNWEMSYFWEDQLQGRIKHNLNGVELFGAQGFRVGIYERQQFLYSFEIGVSNFLY